MQYEDILAYKKKERQQSANEPGAAIRFRRFLAV